MWVRENMKKRKRISEGNRFLCRHHLCTFLHYDKDEIFCEKHRTNIQRSATQLFYSSSHDLIIPEEIVLLILKFNIPYSWILEKKIEKHYHKHMAESYDSHTAWDYIIHTLTLGNVKEILTYFHNISLISREITKLINTEMGYYYRRLYLFDKENQNIKTISLDQSSQRGGYSSSTTIYKELSLNHNHKFLYESSYNEIKEYYNKKFMVKYASKRSKEIKNSLNNFFVHNK